MSIKYSYKQPIQFAFLFGLIWLLIIGLELIRLGKLYSPAEAYSIVRKAGVTMPDLVRAEKSGDMTEPFKERLMLAVTEVNGCRLCSWAHTKVALEAGLSDAEIKDLLAGQAGNTPQEELPAVLFAQHYADARGNPSPEAWAKIVARYGHARALAILGAVRGIMLGNTYGIPLGSLLSRLRGKRTGIDARSSLAYEIGMLTSAVILIPIALLHALAARLLHVRVEP